MLILFNNLISGIKMVTLRCTQKLLRRISEPLLEKNEQPTTLLGDWYANILFSNTVTAQCRLVEVKCPAWDRVTPEQEKFMKRARSLGIEIQTVEWKFSTGNLWP
jgi:hypothetical protein